MPATPYDEAIGKALRSARAAAELSQDEMAQAMTVGAGLSWRQTTVAKIERGARALSAAELWAAAETLGVELHSLVPAAAMKRARRETLRAAGFSAVARGSDWSPRSEATSRAARALGATVARVDELAVARWGRAYYVERERRVSARLRTAPDVADAEIRRQVSREMTSELRESLEDQ